MAMVSAAICATGTRNEIRSHSHFLMSFIEVEIGADYLHERSEPFVLWAWFLEQLSNYLDSLPSDLMRSSKPSPSRSERR